MYTQQKVVAAIARIDLWFSSPVITLIHLQLLHEFLIGVILVLHSRGILNCKQKIVVLTIISFILKQNMTVRR